MRRLQKLILVLAPALALLAFADPALAITHGGTGLFGNTDDSQITNTMFFLLGFFPVVIIVFSGFQMWSEHRRHKKWEAIKAQRASETSEDSW